MNSQRSKLSAYNNRSLVNLKGEKWKSIDEYEEYYHISDFGRVKSLSRRIEFIIPGRHTISYWKPERILSQGISKRWNSISKEYIFRATVTLCVEQEMKTISVSRLVWNAFKSKINFEDDKISVSHKDGDSRNNHYKNLISGDQSFIGKLTYKRGRGIHLPAHFDSRAVAKSAASRSKVVTQYDLKGWRIAIYSSITEAGKKTGVIDSNISLAAKGKKMQMGGFIWRYGKGSKKMNISFYRKAKQESKKRIAKYSKCITQYDLSGNRMKVYVSISEASRSVDSPNGVISHAVAGKNFTAKGFIWRLGKGPEKISTSDYNKSQVARAKRFCKKVIQLTVDGKRINTYPSIKEAALELKCHTDTISMALKGKLKTAKGFVWKYHSTTRERTGGKIPSGASRMRFFG